MIWALEECILGKSRLDLVLRALKIDPAVSFERNVQVLSHRTEAGWLIVTEVGSVRDPWGCV